MLLNKWRFSNSTPCPGNNLPKGVDHWQVELRAEKDVPTGGKHLLEHVLCLKVDHLLQAFTSKSKAFQCLEWKLPQDLPSSWQYNHTSYFWLIDIDQRAMVLSLKHCDLPISSKASFWEPELGTNWCLNETSPFSNGTWDDVPRDFDHRTLPFQRAPLK